MKYALMVLAAAVATVSADGEDCQPLYNKCVASGRNEELCGCDLDACLGEDNQRSHDYCAKVSARIGASSTVSVISGTAGSQPSGQPAINAPAGSLPLGATCSDSRQCKGGAQCYGTTAATIRTCGSFNAACTTDDQCATNTCKSGICSGFLPSESYKINTASQTTAPPTVYTGVCNPAHAYPEQICTVIDGHLTLIPGTLSFGPSGGVPVPFTTTSAPVSAFTGACNPAHAYPEQICTLISGHLTLIPGTLSFGPSGGVPVPAKTTSAPSSAYTGACNPAHAYPEQICTLINGHLTLVPGSLTVGPSGGHPVLPTPVGSPYTSICTTPIYSAGNTTMVKPTASGTQPPSFTGAASVVDTLSGMVALVAGAVAYVL